MNFRVKEDSIFEGRNSFSEIKVFDTATVTYSTVDNANYAEHLKIVPRVSKAKNNSVTAAPGVIRIGEDDPAIRELAKRVEDDPQGTGLLKAAAKGDIAQIKTYLADGADVNVLTGIREWSRPR